MGKAVRMAMRMAVAESLDLRMVEMDRSTRRVKRESKVSTAWARRSKLSIMTVVTY